MRLPFGAPGAAATTTTAAAGNLVAGVRNVLASRWFKEEQIDKIIPVLHDNHIREPKYVAQIIDQWNSIMGGDGGGGMEASGAPPRPARPPKESTLSQLEVDMTTVLADREPRLLLLDPEKLSLRHARLSSLGVANSWADWWRMLHEAPAGWFLQDWVELTKKVYYIENKVMELVYDKSERQAMHRHPLVGFSAATELHFDHIRARYLFGQRCGYRELSFMYKIQTSSNKASLADLLLASDEAFLGRFAPFCTMEEYCAFAKLIKNYDLDEDDAALFERLAELNALDGR